MATLTLSGDELINILGANGVLPPQATDVQADGEGVRVKVRTPWSVVPAVPVDLRFIGFNRGEAVLRLSTNRFLDAFDWLVDRVLAAFPLDEFAARWQYPHLYVDVNRLLRREVRGAEITDVVFRDGHFHITSVHHPADRPDAPEP
jgi:hypothetical protein